MHTLPTIPADTTVYRDVTYVPDGHERQTLDIYLPAGTGPWPVIVYIHGGAFRMGSKSDRVPLAMLARGYALVSLNYRLSQHAIFPAQIEDCKAAVRWLRAHAADYRLNATRIIAWGESAGGHLATMLGVSGHVDAWEVGAYRTHSSRVQGVVDFYGPTDFLQMDTQRLPHGMVHDGADSPESELIGGAIQAHPHATAQANPMTHIRGDAAPFVVIHGDADPLVPYGQSVILV
ncbi:MAG: alpha/beta hydrolase fold domain-containing protein, partial [Roseiflexaceae bacterium]